jgi:hypothetical protein
LGLLSITRIKKVRKKVRKKDRKNNRKKERKKEREKERKKERERNGNVSNITTSNYLISNFNLVIIIFFFTKN